MEKSTRIYLYEKFLSSKKDSKKAKNSELRMALSLLTDNLLKIEKEVLELNNKRKNEIIYYNILKGIDNVRSILINTLQEKNPLSKSVCLLIRFISIIINNLTSKGIKSKILDPIIEEIKKIKTKRELGEKLNSEDLLLWEGKECEDKGEQNIAFIEQRAFLQNDHKKFVEANDIPLLKKLGMRTRMEDLISNFRLLSSTMIEDFGNDLKLREYFIESIPKINEATKQLNFSSKNRSNRLNLWYFILAKWMDSQLESLSKKNLITKWSEIKINLGIKLEELKNDEGKAIANLANEIQKMFFEIIKIEEIEIPEWINVEIDKERIIKFRKWLDKLIFNEFDEQLRQRDAWVNLNDTMTFAIKLKEGK